MAGTELLRIENLHAWYGESHVLHGVNMRVNEGEVVSLLGATAPAAPPRCAPSSA
jgi:ABC-type branched-subunit amino acid transport system ATPase component